MVNLQEHSVTGLWFELMTFESAVRCTAEWKMVKWRMKYRNDPKFLDRQAWANSADPDQTAPEEQSD